MERTAADLGSAADTAGIDIARFGTVEFGTVVLGTVVLGTVVLGTGTASRRWARSFELVAGCSCSCQVRAE